MEGDRGRTGTKEPGADATLKSFEYMKIDYGVKQQDLFHKRRSEINIMWSG